jgi:creatinine amidohydrolase
VQYDLCTYEEIAEFAAAGALAVVPLGCTEQQGPHLPVDFDSWFAETLMLEAAERVRADRGVTALVLPVIPLGPTPEHRSFGAGFLDLPNPLHDAVVTAVLESLTAQGFGSVVVWRGCGGHDLAEAVATHNRAQTRTRVYLPDSPFWSIWCTVGDPNVAGGHADSFTTSIMLAHRPEMVRRDQIPGPSRSPDWDDPSLDFGAYSDSGVIGDPGHASADLGRRLWEESVRWVANYLLDVQSHATTPPDHQERGDECRSS